MRFKVKDKQYDAQVFFLKLIFNHSHVMLMLKSHLSYCETAMPQIKVPVKYTAAATATMRDCEQLDSTTTRLCLTTLKLHSTDCYMLNLYVFKKASNGVLHLELLVC